MNPSDGIISANVYMAASINPAIPISEYARKEFYYRCFTKFIETIAAEPALIKYELLKRVEMFNELYTLESSSSISGLFRFTQGEFRRFAAIMFLLIRRLIQDATVLMKQEKKKRMMPRHLLAAAMVNNMIPRKCISELGFTPEKLERLRQNIIDI